MDAEGREPRRPVDAAGSSVNTSRTTDDDSERKQLALPVPSRSKRPTKKGKQVREAAPRTRKARKSEGAQEDRGAHLERRVARVEFAEGALARLRVPVRADADPGRDVLTDIDVLSIDVDLRLRLTRSILECKSGRGQAGEPDRLFWLAGFKEYLRVERAVLVRTTASRRGVDLARRLGLHLLDGATLGAREAAHAWIPERFAHIGGEECRAAETRTDTQLRAFGEMPAALVSFLRHDALLADPHRNLGALVALERTVGEMGVLPEPMGLVLAGHALTALVLAALIDAAQSETLPNADLRRRLELALTTGSAEDDHILEVLSKADELFRHQVEQIHSAYVDSGAQRLPIELASLRQLVSEPPPWTERYLDLVERLRGNPAIARDLPQTLELVCFDMLLGGGAGKAEAFDHLFTAEHRNLLMVAVQMLREIAGKLLAERLDAVAKIPFDRVPPTVPDRRRSSSFPATSTEPAALALPEAEPAESDQA